MCKIHVIFVQDFTYEKLLKSVNFGHSYSKNKKLDVFGTHCIYILH